MEKEKILSTITEKLGKTSFSNRTIEKYIELNPLAEGQEPDEAYWTKAVGFFQGLEGQYNHDVATQVDEFKRNSNPSTNNQPPSGEPTPNKEVDELTRQLNELKAKVEAKEQSETQADLIKRVREEMKAQRANDEYVLDKTLAGVTLDKSKSVKDLAKEMLERYDAEYKACRGDGTPPRTVGGGGSKEKSSADRFFERKAKREGWAKK